MNLPSSILYALSIKQPWAALIVAGIKSVEVRRWPTMRRGRILIHAARIADPREHGWKLVPRELAGSAELLGGIIGAADLTGCVSYRDSKSFTADQLKHRNDPSWFSGPVMYGFTFANPAILPFRSYPGWMRFFPVEQE
jgi:ASCH domain